MLLVIHLIQVLLLFYKKMGFEMIEINSIEDILNLKEDFDIEFKKAMGKNKGKPPNDF